MLESWYIRWTVPIQNKSELFFNQISGSESLRCSRFFFLFSKKCKFLYKLSLSIKLGHIVSKYHVISLSILVFFIFPNWLYFESFCFIDIYFNAIFLKSSEIKMIESVLFVCLCFVLSVRECLRLVWFLIQTAEP